MGELVCEVTRNGVVECTHFGSVIVLAPSGSVRFEAGSPTTPLYGRSANKLMQSVAMLRAGLRVDARQLALTAASHSGGADHLAVVRSILESVSLAADALGNVVAPPLGDAELVQHARSGAVPSALTMNCSGKHASMLATCVVNGWSIHDYLDPNHPVQQRVLATIEELTEGAVHGVGVDGCGAPAHVVTLEGLAKSVSSMAVAPVGSPSHRVAEAIRHHPVLNGGLGRDVTEFLLQAPGWIGKDGADGVMILASPDGCSVAVKIDDGAARPRIPVAIAALQAAGVELPELPDHIRGPKVFGGGSVVGEVRAVFGLHR